MFLKFHQNLMEPKETEKNQSLFKNLLNCSNLKKNTFQLIQKVWKRNLPVKDQTKKNE